MKILIFSKLDDVHSHAVMEALAIRGDVITELLDLSAFPTHLSLSMAFGEGASEFWLRNDRGWRLDLSSVSAVWWRRPQPFVLPAGMTDPVHRQLAFSEANTAFQGLYQSLDAFWVNEPAKDAAAIHKPWQLKVAQQVGLEIPITLMTSDPEAAREFWRKHEGQVIYKQFLALPAAWRETRRLRPEDEAFSDSVRHAPVIFQRFVDAVADIRVTIIGDEIFAASADVRQSAYPTDVRFNLDAVYKPYKIPSSLADKLRAFMRLLELEYGAIDLRVTPDGRHVFLEINPAGQFLYIEKMTGQKIASALADHLANSARRFSKKN